MRDAAKLCGLPSNCLAQIEILWVAVKLCGPLQDPLSRRRSRRAAVKACVARRNSGKHFHFRWDAAKLCGAIRNPAGRRQILRGALISGSLPSIPES
jgi:hypothetical protein